MIQGPPYELVYQYWPLYEDAIRRFRALVQYNPEARVTSWYRDQARNMDVGGAPRSQHLLALALDFAVAETAKPRLIATAHLLGLIPVDEGNHVHVQRYEAGILPAFLFRGE